jgi:hypothetical protein
MIVYREAFYAFRSRTGKRDLAWWQIFTMRAKYDHVASFHYDAVMEVWNLIEWSEWGLFYGVVSDKELDNYVVFLLTAGGAILRYKAKEGKTRLRFPPISWSYCVSGAKHHANIRSWVLTPDQLFRALRRRGASAAFTAVLEENGDT